MNQPLMGNRVRSRPTRWARSIVGGAEPSQGSAYRSTLQSSVRLLKLLSLLQSRQFWSGADLAERIEVTDRTLRRDVDRLRDLGYVVRTTSGVGGGYQLGPGKDLPPIPLDDEEAVAVALGLRGLTSGGVSGLQESAVRALVKLEQTLPLRLRRRFHALSAFTVRLHGAGPVVDAGLLITMAAACRDQERLRFAYRDRGGAASARTVEPLRLACTTHSWYLLAYDVDRDGWRTFRVDRIEPKLQTGPRFTPRPPPARDLAAYVSRAISTAPWPIHARLTIHAPLERVAQEMPATTGQLEAIDAHRCSYRTGSDSLWALTTHVAAHIAALDVDFEIHEPPELIESFRKLAERAAQAVRREKRGR